jgi:hypothetical protein
MLATKSEFPVSLLRPHPPLCRTRPATATLAPAPTSTSAGGPTSPSRPSSGSRQTERTASGSGDPGRTRTDKTNKVKKALSGTALITALWISKKLPNGGAAGLGCGTAPTIKLPEAAWSWCWDSCFFSSSLGAGYNFLVRCEPSPFSLWGRMSGIWCTFYYIMQRICSLFCGAHKQRTNNPILRTPESPNWTRTLSLKERWLIDFL